MNSVFIVWYFDDLNWVIDSVYSNLESANARVNSLPSSYSAWAEEMEVSN